MHPHLSSLQTPDDIKRQPAPATGEMYTITEPKKGSKKKKEATPPQKSDEELRQMYSQVDMGKKHQPPSGVSVYVCVCVCVCVSERQRERERGCVIMCKVEG